LHCAYIKKISAVFEKYSSDNDGGDSSIANIIKKNMGSNTGVFGYYNFLHEYCREPIDLDDYVDGLQVINVNNKIEAYINKQG
jgi:hypothetical protein